MKILFTIFFLQISFLSLAQIPSSAQNFVMEINVRDSGIRTMSQLRALSVHSANRKIQYFDGLGRRQQFVDWQASSGNKDVVQFFEYDQYGRESKQYLPYAEQNSNDGSFKLSAKNNQGNFYKPETGWDNAAIKTRYPFSISIYEKSPLNRVLQQGFTGRDWQPVSDRAKVGITDTIGHTVVSAYGANADIDTVKLWVLTSDGASTDTVYRKGMLYKKILKDENWINGTDQNKSKKIGTIEEYRDFNDRIVLKRVWETDTKPLNTYYVYDDYGDLRYVIPPGYLKSVVKDNETDFTELIYAYRYDDRRRVVEKKLPGKGWEYIVYNKGDKPILTQDAVQRLTKQWTYTKYDALGRIVSTGIYTNDAASQSTRLQIQALSNGVNPQWEARTGAIYTNQSFPMQSLTPLTINYYDNYLFEGSSTPALQASGIADRRHDKVKTLLTGTKIYSIGGINPLLTINYYDDKARLIQSVSQNHLQGTDRVTNEYDFSGALIKSSRVHTPVVGTATTIITTNEYDHVGRLVQTKKKVNSQAEVIQSRLSYNEIGQLKTKSLHSENGGSNFMTSIAYAYNERGWQTRASAPQFTTQLNYNVNGTTVLGNAQYNGNIAQQLWGHASTTGSTFTYNYDALNRLKSGVSTGTVMSESLTYDDMGNIRTLTRDNGTAITYAYNNSNKSNRLASLSGGLTGSFTYDLNGNATKDRTGMVFTYNQLNLPKTAIGNSKNIAYTYDAMGSKLNRKSIVGGIETQQDYIDGIEYSKSGTASAVIERIATEDGFLLNSSGTYSYYYNLTDHLGNVRSVLKKTGTATAPIATVMQKQDYYPFGKMKSIATSIDNKYLYNGKEMQADLSGGTHTLGSSYVLEGQLDYGARFYDAEIGRWNVVDPLAEKFGNFSPYNYGVNNPVLMVDPTGMAAEYNWGTGKYMDNGREVDFADAMASHGMNADGSSMDPPNEYKYNYETGQYDFVSAQGGNQYDILHYDNASFKINNYAGGERIGPGAWLPKRQLASGALVDANWIIDLGVGVGSISFKLLGNLTARLGSTTLYRAVSMAELDDIAINGIRNASGYQTGKLFATTAEDAANFGKINYFFDKQPFTIIKTSIPNRYLPMLFKGEMDLMPAISVPTNLFNQLSRPNILNKIPLPNHIFFK